MRILAIDSSSMVATVAVVTDSVLTAEYIINHKKTHSQTLLPMIDEIKKNIDLDEYGRCNCNCRWSGVIHRS